MKKLKAIRLTDEEPGILDNRIGVSIRMWT